MAKKAVKLPFKMVALPVKKAAKVAAFPFRVGGRMVAAPFKTRPARWAGRTAVKGAAWTGKKLAWGTPEKPSVAKKVFRWSLWGTPEKPSVAKRTVRYWAWGPKGNPSVTGRVVRAGGRGVGRLVKWTATNARDDMIKSAKEWDEKRRAGKQGDGKKSGGKQTISIGDAVKNTQPEAKLHGLNSTEIKGAADIANHYATKNKGDVAKAIADIGNYERFAQANGMTGEVTKCKYAADLLDWITGQQP